MSLERAKQEQPGRYYRTAGYLMVATASLLFGFNGNLSKLLFHEGVTPITLVEFRMLVGGICLLIVLACAWRKELKLPRRHWGWIIAFGFSMAMVTYTYFVTINLLPIAVALVIQYSSAAWMTLGEAIWRRKLPSPHVLFALSLSIGGLLLLTGIWRLSLDGLNTLGLLFGVLTLLATIAYLLLGQQVGRVASSLTATTYGALVASIFWLCVQPPWSIPPDTWTPHRLLLFSIVGIIGMAIPFALTLGSLRRIDATRISIASMLELVAGGVIAYFWLGEHLDGWQVIGALCVIVGIIVLQYEAAIALRTKHVLRTEESERMPI